MDRIGLKYPETSIEPITVSNERIDQIVEAVRPGLQTRVTEALTCRTIMRYVNVSSLFTNSVLESLGRPPAELVVVYEQELAKLIVYSLYLAGYRATYGVEFIGSSGTQAALEVHIIRRLTRWERLWRWLFHRS